MLLAKRGSDVDSQRIFLRCILLAVNLILIYISVLSFTSSGVDKVTGVTLTQIASLFIVDLLCFYLLMQRYIKQRHNYLVIMKVALYNIFMVLISLIVIAVQAKSMKLVTIVNSQNELFYGLPLWNSVVLLPIFMTWLFSNVDVLRVFQVKKMNSEIDLFQVKSLYSIRVISAVTLCVALFFGGQTSFGVTDSFNLSLNLLNLVDIIAVVVKALLILALIKFYLKFSSIKRISELEDVFKKRSIMCLLTFVCLCIGRLMWIY